jgi:UDP-N-acetylglucosamine 2-epimerase (non-hydrolysing)
MGIPVVRVGAGMRVEPSWVAEAGGRESTEALADLWYPSDEQASRELANEGIPAARIHCAGNLINEAVQTALSALQDPMRSGAFHRMVIPFSSEDWSYALVLIEDPKHVADRQSVVALIAFLRRISRSVALVLQMRSDAEHEFNKHRLHREIFGERICHLPEQGYANQLELLRNATCVLTDSRDVREEAITVHIPCLAIGIRAESAVPPPDRTATIGVAAHALAWAIWPFSDGSDLPDRRDGLTSARIAEHLCAWLRHLKPRPPVS